MYNLEHLYDAICIADDLNTLFKATVHRGTLQYRQSIENDSKLVFAMCAYRQLKTLKEALQAKNPAQLFILTELERRIISYHHSDAEQKSAIERLEKQLKEHEEELANSQRFLSQLRVRCGEWADDLLQNDEIGNLPAWIADIVMEMRKEFSYCKSDENADVKQQLKERDDQCEGYKK